MNKTELIAKIAEKTGLSKKAAGEAVDAYNEIVEDTVAAGEKVEMLNFGTFEPRARSARTGRNPQTGVAIPIPARRLPGFKPGARFKSKMKG